jgi:enamine deaminase RidA (YjgF/YER057c/UK114 family)
VVLEMAGLSHERALQAVIWLAEKRDIAEMNGFGMLGCPKRHAPAPACGEAALARPELSRDHDHRRILI